MLVNLKKMYKSFNKVFVPGEYNINDLPISIRSNSEYVEELITRPVTTEVASSEPVTLKIKSPRKKENASDELIVEDNNGSNN